MKHLTFIISILIFCSCGQNSQDPAGVIKSSDGSEFDSAVTAKDKTSELESKPFSDPAIIYGSDFGHFFQEMYKLGDYDGMLAFTSSESITLHGERTIVEHYKNMTFGFEFGKLKKIQEEDGRISMFYLSDIDATKVRFILHVKVENDSCKVLIHQNLKDFPLKF
jgi:hypothetical protein